MIGKLRKKFIVTALVSVFALLFTILLVINVVNFALVTADADRVTEMLTRGAGRFDEGINNAPGTPPDDFRGGQFGPDSPETGASTRYFTVKFSSDGSAEMVSYRVSIVESDEAIEWARSLADKSVGWTHVSYRYRVWHEGGDAYVTVIDFSREMRPSLNVLWGSLIGGLVGLLVTFLALLPISKAVIKPIEKNDREQRRFISDAAYELKTPLSVIDVNRKTLEIKNGETTETKAIKKEVGYLTDFTGKLDTLVQVKNGTGKENFREVDLSKLANEVAGPYKELFIGAGKALSVDIQPDVKVNGDPMKLTEMLNDCLENALKFAETQATLSIKGAPDRVTIDLSNDAQDVVDGDLDSVFETFYRSEEVRKSGVVGSGIGLSIVKSVVESHGGRVKARGENGRFFLKIEL